MKSKIMMPLSGMAGGTISASAIFSIEYKEAESEKYDGLMLPYYKFTYTGDITVTSTPSSKYQGVNLPTVRILY